MKNEIAVIHGYWYRNSRFPFFHYKEPLLIILKGNKVYSWNGQLWIEKKTFEAQVK